MILVMGVSASGKSAVGRALAEALGGTFVEGDDEHSEVEIARMASGTPLDDEARWPWLRRVRVAIDEAIRDATDGSAVVVACSALKSRYRAVLLDGIGRSSVVLLEVDRVTLGERLRDRPSHFMPPALLDSQLADLEPPADALRVDATRDVEGAVETVLAALDTLPRADRSYPGTGRASGNPRVAP